MPPVKARHRHWLRVLLSVLTLGLVVVLVLRAGSARKDFVQAFERVKLSDLPWLGAAVAAQALSLACYSAAQRRLLKAGGAALRFRTVFGLTVGATGIGAVVPGGVVPASGWLISQFRIRKVPVRLAVWAVLAGGFVATVSILGLLLVGAGVAGVGNAWVLAATGVVLVGGSAAFVVGVHHLTAVEQFLRRHHLKRGVKAAHWLSRHACSVSSFRAGRVGGAEVFAFSILNWLFDTACLLAAFAAVGLPIPWHTALFAYAVSQVASSLVPLPSGIGIVEGGLLGVFTATGTPAAQALVGIVVYRIVNYWAVAGVGSLTALFISHHGPGSVRSLGHPDPEEAATDRPLADALAGEGRYQESA
jgi:uncharacterized protein (TIRG00374 family)